MPSLLVYREERSLQPSCEKAAQLIHRRLATYEVEAPMHSRFMSYACAASKSKHHLLLFEKDRYSNVEGRCNSKTLRCLSEIVAVTLTGSKKFLQSANKRHCPSRPMKKSKSLPRAENKLDKNSNS